MPAFSSGWKARQTRLRILRRSTGPLMRRGAELHIQHIAHGGDPFEMGSARPLDLATGRHISSKC